MLTRAEYAKRAKQLYQPTPAPFAVNALFLVVCILNMLVIYEDIGPPALAARVALLAVVNGMFWVGASSSPRRSRVEAPADSACCAPPALVTHLAPAVCAIRQGARSRESLSAGAASDAVMTCFTPPPNQRPNNSPSGRQGA